MQIYDGLKQLAKENKTQNLFSASREIFGVRLFNNELDLSKIQQVFINYLYFYENLITDVMSNSVSDKVLLDDVYAEAYVVYKKKDKSKDKPEDKQREIHLIPARTIKFKKEVS